MASQNSELVALSNRCTRTVSDLVNVVDVAGLDAVDNPQATPEDSEQLKELHALLVQRRSDAEKIAARVKEIILQQEALREYYIKKEGDVKRIVGDRALKKLELEEERKKKSQATEQGCKDEGENTSSEIDALAESISALGEEQARYHELSSAVIQDIVFVSQAFKFWSLFLSVSDTAHHFNEGLISIMQKAKEKPQLMQSRAVGHIAEHFLQAWEEEMAQLEAGKSHIFLTKFTCAKCNGSKFEMPHVLDHSLVCADCK